MKVVNAFATLFAVLAFLTLGSLMVMVSLHLLSLDDALLKVQEIYNNPWRSLQIGMVGFMFIFVGLAFAKMLIKRSRQTEALVFQGELGLIVVSATAIEDIVKKVLKRFHLVKEWKTKITIDERDVEIKLRCVLWAGGDVPSLLSTVQQEIQGRLRKILGPESQIEIFCDVIRIEESELDVEGETIAV